MFVALDRRHVRSQSDSQIADELDKILMSPRHLLPLTVPSGRAADALTASIHWRAHLSSMEQSQHGSQHAGISKVSLESRRLKSDSLIDELDKVRSTLRYAKSSSPTSIERLPEGEANGEGPKDSLDRFARLVTGTPRRKSALGTTMNGQITVSMESKIDKIMHSLQLDPACIRTASSDPTDGSSEPDRRRPSYMETTRSYNRKIGPDK